MNNKIIRITVDYQLGLIKVIAETPKYTRLLHIGRICDNIPVDILPQCQYSKFYITEIH